MARNRPVQSKTIAFVCCVIGEHKIKVLKNESLTFINRNTSHFLSLCALWDSVIYNHWNFVFLASANFEISYCKPNVAIVKNLIIYSFNSMKYPFNSMTMVNSMITPFQSNEHIFNSMKNLTSIYWNILWIQWQWSIQWQLLQFSEKFFSSVTMVNSVVMYLSNSVKTFSFNVPWDRSASIEACQQEHFPCPIHSWIGNYMLGCSLAYKQR